MIGESLDQVDAERPILLLRPLLQNEHSLHPQARILEFLLAGDDVAHLVLVEDAAQLVASVGVLVDRHEAVQVGHHQVPVHQLEQVQHGFGLVFGRPHLDQGTD